MLRELRPHVDDRLFWPAFLLAFGGSDTAARAFDVDPADVMAYAEELHQPNSWPFLTVQLAHGHRVHLLFRNFDGDAGWDYLFQPAGSDSVVTLAALEGCFQGPGLAWPELLHAAAQWDPARTPSERLLLLLPAVGDAGLPSDALEVVGNAFTDIGGRPEYRYEVATELVTASDRFWGSPVWTWHEYEYVCSDSHSPRNVGASPRNRALISEALESIN